MASTMKRWSHRGRHRKVNNRARISLGSLSRYGLAPYNFIRR
ncbi:hypothetical protein ACFQZ4_50340 [Catellatospora coxensis]